MLRGAAAQSTTIVGGGFTGLLTAINLLRFGSGPVALVERGELGGAAYGGHDRGQLLNVRAGNMSAYPDRPNHFAEWLRRQGDDESGFARRADYGRYLREELQAAADGCKVRLTVIADTAQEVAQEGTGWTVTGANTAVSSDRLVLAFGNQRPAAPPGLDAIQFPKGAYIDDPWRSDVSLLARTEHPVLILGTGLTMVDVALYLGEQLGVSRIVALSRRGLLPRRHASLPPPPRLDECPSGSLRDLTRGLRQRAQKIDWRLAIDQLRPFTQTLWSRLSLAERRAFLRHLRPWWDAHRHRLAPLVADRLDRLRERGVLSITRGRLDRCVPAGSGVSVRWVEPDTGPREQTFAAIINCTGPASLSARSDPLLASLIDAGHAVLDPLGLGLAVDRNCRVIDRNGQAHDNLYAAGPLTRGAFWEVTAVPDIRRQVWDLARHMTHSHWVGGEGL